MIFNINSTRGHTGSLLVYTIVACTFKRKSSAARFALNLTAETQVWAQKSTALERLSCHWATREKVGLACSLLSIIQAV